MKRSIDKNSRIATVKQKKPTKVHKELAKAQTEWMSKKRRQKEKQMEAWKIEDAPDIGKWQ